MLSMLNINNIIFHVQKEVAGLLNDIDIHVY